MLQEFPYKLIILQAKQKNNGIIVISTVLGIKKSIKIKRHATKKNKKNTHINNTLELNLIQGFS